MVLGASPAPRKGQDAELGRCHQLPDTGLGLDHGLGPFSDVHAGLNGRSDARHPVGLEGQPQLQRPGFTAQLQRPVEQVNPVFAAHHVFEVFGRHRKGALQRTGVAYQHHAAVVGLEQPFVRVDHQGVGQFHARQFESPLRGECCGCAVGTVHMEPQVFGAGQGGEFRQRIDRAGVGGAGVADDHHRLEAGGFVRLDGMGQHAQVVFLLRVGRKHPDIGRAQTRGEQVALQRRMGLVVGVNHTASLGGESGCEGGEVGE